MNTEENRLYLCANTGAKCENPTMIKGTDLCYCDRRYLKSVKVENLAEEKLQQAALNYIQNNTTLAYDSFIAGAKSPESLEYWKEKRNLYDEVEIRNLVMMWDSEGGVDWREVDKFFEKNKK